MSLRAFHTWNIHCSTACCIHIPQNQWSKHNWYIATSLDQQNLHILFCKGKICFLRLKKLPLLVLLPTLLKMICLPVYLCNGQGHGLNSTQTAGRTFPPFDLNKMNQLLQKHLQPSRDQISSWRNFKPPLFLLRFLFVASCFWPTYP